MHFVLLGTKCILCSIIVFKNYTRTAHSKGTIWDEFSVQNQHQKIKRHHIYFNDQLALFFEKKVEI